MADVTIKSYRKEREKEIIDSLQKGLEKVGLIVERQAKINVSQSTGHPKVQTGRLRSSITHNVSPGEVEIGSNVVYSKYLEFGTSKMPPYPFLFPAVELKKPEIIEALKGHNIVIE
jgi:HK97 gp10 family phage protein